MSAKATLAWSRPFDDPIPVPGGHVLRTPHDAGHYAAALPKATQERTEWQAVGEMLILAVQGQRPVMLAEIAMRQALYATMTRRHHHGNGASRCANIESCANLCCSEPMCVWRRALDFLETCGVPVTAQLTAAAVQREYEQLYVRYSLPAAFAANMHSFPLRMVQLHDSTTIAFYVAAQLALAVKLFSQNH